MQFSDARCYTGYGSSLECSHEFDLFSKTGLSAFWLFLYLEAACAGIQEMLSRVCSQKKIEEKAFFDGLKKKGQWHVEVY